MDRRTEVAYLLWQIAQGCIAAEDRAAGTNWMYDPDDRLHPDDIASRANFLEAADTLIEIMDRKPVLSRAATANGKEASDG